MTDKIAKNKAEALVILAGATDTAHDSELKSRALPQADALKERFKAGSIPLQTDFADLIDMADIGRQAVGDMDTGFGLAKDGKNRLQLDPSIIANLTYDLSPSKGNQQIVMNNRFVGEVDIHERVALLTLSEDIGPVTATTTKFGSTTTYRVEAVKINADGVRKYTTVTIIADKSIGKDSETLPFEYVNYRASLYSLWYRFTLDTSTEDFSNCTLVIDTLTLVVKYIKDFNTLPLDGEIISLLNVSFVYHGVIIGDGLQVNNMKISAKVDESKGLQVNSSGISVKTGNGVAVNTSGINIKLAKGTSVNGGGGQGSDGTTSGSSGGLNVMPNGLSVDAGNGIQINQQGVSLKLATNSGLSADETNGLKIVPEQMFQKNMVMMFAGTVDQMPKGWALCDGDGGRPDLRDRFVLGSTGFSNVNQTNGKKVTGTNVDKQYMVNSDAKTPAVSVTVNNHTLTTSEIPSHNHNDGVRYSWDSGEYDIDNVDEYGLSSLSYHGSSTKKYAKLQNYSNATNNNLHVVKSSGTGGSGGHNHTASSTQSSHQHNTNVVPPYYILAFIIKL